MTITANYFPTVISGGSSWASASSVTALDDVPATAVVTRDLYYPYGYTAPYTDYLSTSVYTGIATGMVAGDTLLGIEIEIRAKQSRSDVDVELSVNAVPSLGDAQTVSLTDEWQTFTLGGTSSLWGVDWWLGNYELLTDQVRPNVRARMTTGIGTATVSIDYISMRINFTSSACAAFAFTPVAGVVGDWIYSNIITISGLPESAIQAPVSFSGERIIQGVSVQAVEVQKNNDGRWVNSLDASVDRATNGDTFQLRRKLLLAPFDTLSPSVSDLSVNGVSAYFSTSVTQDRTPSVPITSTYTTRDLPLNTWVKVPLQFKVAGVNAYNATAPTFTDGAFTWFPGVPTPASGTLLTVTETLTGPMFEAGYVTPSATGAEIVPVQEGSLLEFWALTPNTYATLTTFLLYVGDQIVTWNAYTVAADTAPSITNPTTLYAQPISTVVTSDVLPISGLTGTASVSFLTAGGSSHQYSKNGGAWTALGATTVVNGDTIQLRMTTPGVSETLCNIAMTIGGCSVSFCAATGSGSPTPGSLSFGAATGGIPGVISSSSVVTLSGITPAQTVYATVRQPGAELKVGAGAWASGPAAMVNGQTLQVRAPANLSPGKADLYTVRIAGGAGIWGVTTQSANTWE